MKKSPFTFWQWLDLVPPVLARLLAVKRIGTRPERPLTDSEIAYNAGITADEVWVLSNMTSWKRVDMPTARSFLRACDCDFTDRMVANRIQQYMRWRPGVYVPPQFRFLKKSPEWKSKYEPLLVRYAHSLKPKTHEHTH